MLKNLKTKILTSIVPIKRFLLSNQVKEVKLNDAWWPVVRIYVVGITVQIQDSQLFYKWELVQDVR